MKLTIEEVKHVATLARLGLTDDELRLLQDQLSTILSHIDALNELDTEAISPTAQVIDLVNVLRDDEVQSSLEHDIVLQNAPRQANGCFEVLTPLASGESSA